MGTFLDTDLLLDDDIQQEQPASLGRSLLEIAMGLVLIYLAWLGILETAEVLQALFIFPLLEWLIGRRALQPIQPNATNRRILEIEAEVQAELARRRLTD